MESAIFNLRAEVHRKKASASNVHLDESDIKKRIKPLEKQQSRRDETRSTSNRPPPKPTNEDSEASYNEEHLKLENSRKALEKKAILYQNIKDGIDVLENDDLNQKYLVNFQEKIARDVAKAKEEKEEKIKQIEDSDKLTANYDQYPFKAETSEEEWVEYMDSFGRTRVCQKKDLDIMKKQVTKQPSREEEINKNKFHKEWDQIEEESKNKSGIHYQDVLFDEARSHGTGYMPFSRDEAQRAEQQSFLRDLNAETVKAALSKQSLRRSRDKAMKERLAKVRQKKRLKMGLPVTDDRYKTPPPSDEEEVEEVKAPEEAAKSESSKGEEDEKQVPSVREWDLGKPGVSPLMSQEQWIESRRTKRDEEFAPPSEYSSKASGRKKRDERRRTSEERTKEEERRPEFAPPPSFDYYRPISQKRNFSKTSAVDVEAAISQGLAQLRKQTE